jgi:hypothetical protein
MLNCADLPAARRAGLCRLIASASALGFDTDIVIEVCGAAWASRRGFDAQSVPGYREVVDLAVRTNGSEWTDAVVVDSRLREEAFMANRHEAHRYAKRNFGRLPADDRQAAADDAILELDKPKFRIPNTEIVVSAWDVLPLVYDYAYWRLLTAAEKFDEARTGGDGTPIVPLDLALEISALAITPLGYGADVDDSGVEAEIWRSAGQTLSERRAGQLDTVRAGASREKLNFTIRSAAAVLARGADSDEIRQSYVQDPLLICFLGLSAVAPTTWGRYPNDKVPTREVLKQAALEAAQRHDPNVEFFGSIEGRRKELNDSCRLLHEINRLVEATLKEAAQGDDH